ncbi:MAG TPA: protein kinase [Candidatus Brocadiia bacterium]|nr:protein kinase [Candidatus Brocadiia bacterium]
MEAESVMKPKLGGKRPIARKPPSSAVKPKPPSTAPPRAPSSGVKGSGDRGSGGSGRASEFGTDISASGIFFDRTRYVRINPGDVVAGFRIEEILGAGAMAVVYRAVQLSLNRSVALKVLPERFAKNPSFVERFDKESGALAALNHPNIISVIDRGHDGEKYFFAMEYVEGTSLRHLIQSGNIPSETFCRIVQQICDGLDYAHKRGVIHRDIKPSNIMLNSEGNVKIADFGLAGIVAEEGTSNGGGRPRKRIVMGTKGYMSPEQEENALTCDGRSDIFSLGIVLYEMLTDELPDPMNLVVPSEVNHNVDPRLDPIVTKCLQIRPEDRYQRASQVAEAIAAYYRELTATGELCPKCKNENPVRAKKCVRCGHDLSELFEICPQCKSENRRDVKLCFSCGANLNALREKISYEISHIQDEAEHLQELNHFDEAIAKYQEILAFQGKMFEFARNKARKNIAAVQQARAKLTEKLQKGVQKCIAKGMLDDAEKYFDKLKMLGVDCSEHKKVVEARKQEFQQYIVKVKERMAAYDVKGAAQEFAEAAKIWPKSAELEKVGADIKKLSEEEDIINFQIKNADELLAKHDFKAAKATFDFMTENYPNHPRIGPKIKEIEIAEKKFNIDSNYETALTFLAGKRYSEAIYKMQHALEVMPQDDARHKKAEETIAEARAHLSDLDAVAPAIVLAGMELPPPPKKKWYQNRNLWIGVGSGIGALVLILGVVIAVTMIKKRGGGGGSTSAQRYVVNWDSHALPSGDGVTSFDMAAGKAEQWELKGWKFAGQTLQGGGGYAAGVALCKELNAREGVLEAVFRPVARDKKESLPKLDLGLIARHKNGEYLLFSVKTTEGATAQGTLETISSDASRQSKKPGMTFTYDGEVIKLELRLEGNNAKGLVNGKEVISNNDITTMPEDGLMGIYAKRTDLECKYLALKPLEKVAVVTPPPDAWVEPANNKGPENPPVTTTGQQSTGTQQTPTPPTNPPPDTPVDPTVAQAKCDIVVYFEKEMKLGFLHRVAEHYYGNSSDWRKLIAQNKISPIDSWLRYKVEKDPVFVANALKDTAPDWAKYPPKVFPLGTFKDKTLEDCLEILKKAEGRAGTTAPVTAPDTPTPVTGGATTTPDKPIEPVATTTLSYSVDESPVEVPPPPLVAWKGANFRNIQEGKWIPRGIGSNSVSEDGTVCSFKRNDKAFLFLSDLQNGAIAARLKIEKPDSISKGGRIGIVLNYREPENKRLFFGMERINEGLVARAWEATPDNRRDGIAKLKHIEVGEDQLDLEFVAYMAGGRLYGFLNRKLAAVLEGVGDVAGFGGIESEGVEAACFAPSFGVPSENMGDVFEVPPGDEGKVTKDIAAGAIETDSMSRQIMIAGLEDVVDADFSFVFMPVAEKSQVRRATIAMRYDAKTKDGVFLNIDGIGKGRASFNISSKSGDARAKSKSGERGLEFGKSCHIRFSIRGKTLVAYVDGDEVCRLTEGDILEKGGMIGFSAYGCTARWSQFEIP